MATILCDGMFENDVEMYGAQTKVRYNQSLVWFENDVEMYGAQTAITCID